MDCIEKSFELLEQMPNAILVFAPSGEIIHANKSARNMLGFESSELIGRQVTSLIFTIDMECFKESMLDIEKIISKRQLSSTPARFITVSGQHVEVSIDTKFINDKSKEHVATILELRNIDYMLQVEEQLKFQNELLEEEIKTRTVDTQLSKSLYNVFLEQIPMPILTLNQEGTIVSINRAAKHLFECGDEVIGNSADQILMCQRCPPTQACFNRAAKHGRWVGECAMHSRDGKPKMMYHVCSPLYDSEDRTTGTIHAIIDLASNKSPLDADAENSTHILLDDSMGKQEIMIISPAMKKVLNLVTSYAQSNDTILLQGESGVGKDVIARAIHQYSSRADKPFLTINCATLDSNFLVSELFGHERGAFTGAQSSKKGLMEEANGGTLFIDELADMSPRVQAMLLIALETGTFRSMGSNVLKKVNVRLITATNKSLEGEAELSNFRHDLFYRLNVLNISIPPLRERKEDITVLANTFLAKADSDDGSKKAAKHLTERAQKALLQYSWPGNVRELKNMIRQAEALAKDEIYVDLAHFPDKLANCASSEGQISTESFKSLTLIEQQHIEEILKANNWNKTRSASILGVSRTTLIAKIKKYKIKQPD